ncbi:MAG: sigma 54-interacting transcriptional regulator [Firmicutes bacterium]|nr:sigma 54-interacting transcriptional regulator [Bacillota bacterium]NSW91518.1 sigma 54-interacting transcriptional regulator [Bacillota bacterium]
MLSLTLLSLTANTAVAIQKQLKEIFEDMVDIKSVCFEELSPNTEISDALVVVTSQTIKDDALNNIRPGTKILFADRIVNIESVSKLYEVPEGALVLVVNKLYDTATQAIDQLIRAGITHLQFYPYYPGMVNWNRSCKYVVTFGEKQLVPEGEFEIIDLGIRPIDINTCIEISMELNIYEKVKHTLTSVFFRPSLRLLYHYSQEYNKNLFLTKRLQQLLNIFKSGIVLLDQDGKISFFNHKAEQLLQIKENFSSHIKSVLDKSKVSGKDFFLSINGIICHIEIDSSSFGEDIGTIIVIEDIKNIEKIEKNYRYSLHEKGLTAKYTFDNIFYKSKKMEQLIMKARQFAKSDSTILIEGESGTGKELIAQAIHNASGRSGEAFVAVNFAALSESLCESELFGYEEGAFTGAKKGGKIGLFVLAHKGTIFLDEIGDATINIQKKVLRAIQERQIIPVGGSQVIPVDIRIIAATNRDLQAMVNEGLFRQDLYYRLSVLPLRLPSLRERTEDIFPLFVNILKNQFKVNLEEFPNILREELERYKWPGNVRELRNVAEYMANFIQLNMDWEEEFLSILRSKINKTMTENDTYTEAIIRRLEEHSQILNFISILKALDSPPFKWTRKRLFDVLKNSEVRMSESQIKRHLLVLKELDLIQATTGAGTYIKDSGRAVINQFERNMAKTQ